MVYWCHREGMPKINCKALRFRCCTSHLTQLYNARGVGHDVIPHMILRNAIIDEKLTVPETFTIVNVKEYSEQSHGHLEIRQDLF